MARDTITEKEAVEQSTAPTFDYSVWTPNTTIQLCNVPWDSSYRDIVKFADANTRDDYFASITQSSINLSGCVYLRYGRGVRVNVSFSQCNQCNYLVVKNPIQPVPGYDGFPRVPDTFYYFVSDITYIAPNTTELMVQLDVWQTYYQRISFGMCYIERGHIGIANENATPENASRYLIEPEGLEIGAEYDVNNQAVHNLCNVSPYVIVMTTATFLADPGTLDKPNLETSQGGYIQGCPNGCEVWALDSPNFKNLMEKVKKYPWVSQCISMMTIVPREFCNVSDEKTYLFNSSTMYGYAVKQEPNTAGKLWTINNALSLFSLPARYAKLWKMYTAPYTYLELTAYEGSQLMLRPECMRLFNGAYRIGNYSVCNPPFIKAAILPAKYNTDVADDLSLDFNYYTPDDKKHAVSYDYGEFLDMALMLQDWPQCALVNNSYMLYMASNAHTLQYSRESADWSQQKALNAAQLSYDQSSAGTQNMLANTGVGINAAWAQQAISNEGTYWNAGVNAVTGIAGALGTGNAAAVGGAAAGALVGAANAMKTVELANRSTGVSTSATQETAGNNARLANYNRDTNYDYASWAARGDYAMAIGAIQAKVDDAKLMQPATIGQAGGNLFNITLGFMTLNLKFKVMKKHFITQIGEYWLRYGYAINRFIDLANQPLLNMSNFSYWKMQSCSIFGNMPQVHRDAIRGIFESGTTVWADPNKVNRIDVADNDPVKGVNY